MFLGIYLFHLGCPICSCIIVHSSLRTFCVSAVTFVTSPLSFLILSPLSLWWVWLKVCLLCLSFQKLALMFIDLYYCIFNLYFIYFCFDLCYFLLCINVGLCSLSSSLRCKVRLLILKLCLLGTSGWLSRLSNRLQLRSWSYDLMVHEFHPRIWLWAGSSAPGACFRFWILSPSLSASPLLMISLSLSLSLFLSLKNK